MIENFNWHKEFNAAVTVCDENGIIIYMNLKAQKTFEKYGGTQVIGKNVLDCHPEPARSKLKMLIEKKIENTYTVEKNGIKKIIHQAPWFAEGNFKGFVEISIEISQDMPHYKRT